MSFPSLPPANGDVREILLREGMCAIVDAADFDWLSQFRWHADPGHNGVWYASRTACIPARDNGGRRKVSTIRMHREVIAAPAGVFVDHINHNGLDNRRANLRICNNGQNLANSRSRRPGQFRGVYRAGAKWFARVGSHPYKPKFLGRFDTAEEAARAYDIAAKERFGAFATLNFPDAHNFHLDPHSSRTNKGS